MASIIISKVHSLGFAFAITSDGDQVFIPPHLVDGFNTGDTVEAVIAANPIAEKRTATPWMAVKIVKDQAKTEPELVMEPARSASPSMVDRDEAVYDLICNEMYISTSDIAADLGLDTKTAGNSAARLFNAGRISKAEVYNRVGQDRCTFILWAKDSSDFLSCDGGV